MTALTPGSEERFKKLHHRLRIAEINNQLGVALGSSGTFTLSDVAFLLSVASRFALGEDKHDQAIAYEVVTKLAELLGNVHPIIIDAANVVFSRLGNFPARLVTKKRFGGERGLDRYLSLPALEAMSREQENTVVLQEQEIILTDFQFQLFDVRAKWQSVSVSAPTSAGKSYLISIDVMRYLLKRTKKNVVILVPTRALIRQPVLFTNRVLGWLDGMPIGR
jgi:hypothetical protein